MDTFGIMPTSHLILNRKRTHTKCLFKGRVPAETISQTLPASLPLPPPPTPSRTYVAPHFIKRPRYNLGNDPH